MWRLYVELGFDIVNKIVNLRGCDVSEAAKHHKLSQNQAKRDLEPSRHA